MSEHTTTAKKPRAIRVVPVTRFNRPRMQFYRIWRVDSDGLSGHWWGGANGWVAPGPSDHDNVIEYRTFAEANRVASALRRIDGTIRDAARLNAGARRLAKDALIPQNTALAILEAAMDEELDRM